MAYPPPSEDMPVGELAMLNYDRSVNVCVLWRPIQGVISPHTRCSQERLRIHCDWNKPEQDIQYVTTLTSVNCDPVCQGRVFFEIFQTDVENKYVTFNQRVNKRSGEELI